MLVQLVGHGRCTLAQRLARHDVTWSDVGLVVSGAATAAFDDGRVYEVRAGELFCIPPVPHDSWVVGTQPYVSRSLMPRL